MNQEDIESDSEDIIKPLQKSEYSIVNELDVFLSYKDLQDNKTVKKQLLDW